MVRGVCIFISDLPCDRAAATRCGGIFTAGAEHHRAQGLLVEPVSRSAAEVEPAIDGIKGGRDSIDRRGQRQAIPSRQARRDRDSGCRGLAAVLIREGEQFVEQDRAVVLHVAGSQVDAAADHGFLVEPHHAHRADDGRAPLGQQTITVGIQHRPADRAAGSSGWQTAGAAAVGDRAQHRLIIRQAGCARQCELTRAVVVAAGNPGNGGVSQLIAAQPAVANGHKRLFQLGVIAITEAQGWGLGQGRIRFGVNQRATGDTTEHWRIR